MPAIPIPVTNERLGPGMCEWEGDHHPAQMHCTNLGGLILQASVNWRKGPLVG